MHSEQFTPANFDLPAEAATDRLGACLARSIHPGCVVYLEGDLGAGKTALVRACLRALGHTGPVKSPTYALVEHYVISSLYLYHFDFYRFDSPGEFIEAGFDEYFNENAICLVEWPERAAGYLPKPDLRFRVQHADVGRTVQVCADSALGATCLSELNTAWSDAGFSGGQRAP